MPSRMEYLNRECKKLEEKLNTPERLQRLAEVLGPVLSRSYDREVKGLKFKISASKIRSYAYSYEGVTGENPQFIVSLVSDKDCFFFNVLSFSIAIYPHCCGMMQLNGFSHNMTNYSCEIISQDEMEELMGEFVKIYRAGDDYQLVRIIMNMVERRGSMGRDDLREVEPVEKPDIQYPAFWTWAHKQKRVRDMLMVNGNSGNILHHMEVILN
jgi:hypothetical protein